MTSFLKLAAAPLVLLSTVAVATPPADAPRAVVRYADLNLASHEGAATLQRRVETAARAICGDPSQRDLAALQASRACRDTVRADAKVQIAAIMPDANGRVLAINTVQLPAMGK